ncbi:MAG: taurine dioxygenase [Alphaproteobacteria bacterium]|nr:taurine dioxygenase [Alphaproteobacteria bacterium]
MGTYSYFEVKPLSGAVGAVLSGIDISEELSADAIAEMRQAWLEHLVIFFRDQQLSDERLMAFGRRFGDLYLHPNLAKKGSNPEVIHVVKEPDATRVVGAEWHTDTAHVECPPMGAILHALEVPPRGGDTLFANQYLAYEALSDGLKAALDGMKAVHNDSRVAGPNANKGRSTQTRDDEEWTPTENAHPVIRTHPETGRKGLFVNVASAHKFEGMRRAESAALLQYLFKHATRPEFTCRFNWEPGSVAFWDNRCLKHIAVNDYQGHRRDMRRVQLVGDKPT